MAKSETIRERFDREALVHAEALYRFARRLCRDDSQAEDLFQEAYERAYRFFYQFREGSNCKSWLFTILHTLHRQRLRSRSTRQESISIDEASEFFLHDRLLEQEKILADNPEKIFFDQCPSGEIRAALSELSEDLRSAVLLYDVEGFSYQEIATILGVPLGTVRSRISRGRSALHKRLWQAFQQTPR
ncbi:sigma-70 family RNA polymerase sigma factor [bacterium CPR1]|nr:sigma-70 family RNA polymerase sigma factor [bacterium CPR1]